MKRQVRKIYATVDQPQKRFDRMTIVVAVHKLEQLPLGVKVIEVFKIDSDGPVLERSGVEGFKDDERYQKYSQRRVRLHGIRKYVYRMDVLECRPRHGPVTHSPCIAAGSQQASQELGSRLPCHGVRTQPAAQHTGISSPALLPSPLLAISLSFNGAKRLDQLTPDDAAGLNRWRLLTNAKGRSLVGRRDIAPEELEGRSQRSAHPLLFHHIPQGSAQKEHLRHPRDRKHRQYRLDWRPCQPPHQ